MSDYLVKAIDVTSKLRLLTVSATNLANQAQLRHNTWPASTAALGRTLIGTLLLAAAELTGKEELTTRVLGNGPVGGIIATAKADFTVKGYIQNPHVQLPAKKPGHIDVGRAVGKKGFLEVTKDLGLKEPYTGQVPLVSGEIAQDFTYYLAKSEQIPSATGLSVFVNPDETVGAAGGFMLEALPGASDDLLTKVTDRIQTLPALSKLFLDGEKPEDLAKHILGDDCKLLEKDPVMYLCDCSKAKYAKILMTLKPEELKAMADEDHGCELTCKFCGEKYRFTEDELRELIAAQEDK